MSAVGKKSNVMPHQILVMRPVPAVLDHLFDVFSVEFHKSEAPAKVISRNLQTESTASRTSLSLKVASHMKTSVEYLVAPTALAIVPEETI